MPFPLHFPLGAQKRRSTCGPNATCWATYQAGCHQPRPGLDASVQQRPISFEDCNPEPLAKSYVDILDAAAASARSRAHRAPRAAIGAPADLFQTPAERRAGALPPPPSHYISHAAAGSRFEPLYNEAFAFAFCGSLGLMTLFSTRRPGGGGGGGSGLAPACPGPRRGVGPKSGGGRRGSVRPDLPDLALPFPWLASPHCATRCSTSTRNKGGSAFGVRRKSVALPG